MGSLKRHLASFALTLLCSSAVMTFVVAMNAVSTPPPKAEREEATVFEVKKKPKKKERPQRKRPRKVQRRSSAKPPPMPDLSTAISAVDLSLSGFASSEIGGVDQRALGQVQKQSVMTEDALDSKPKALRRAPLKAPEKAVRRGITGQVTVSLLLGEDGRVRRTRVLDAEPPGMFEEAALASLEQWEFERPTYQGEAVSVWLTQVVRFQFGS